MHPTFQHYQALEYQWKRELYCTEQVDGFKAHLLSHLAPAIAEKVLDTGVLIGLSKAIARKKGEWTHATDMTM